MKKELVDFLVQEAKTTDRDTTSILPMSKSYVKVINPILGWTDV